nr:hypothetical protein [Chroococcidiopsis sp. SAG 2025]
MQALPQVEDEERHNKLRHDICGNRLCQIHAVDAMDDLVEQKNDGCMVFHDSRV